jgi:hypothetical protein
LEDDGPDTECRCGLIFTLCPFTGLDISLRGAPVTQELPLPATAGRLSANRTLAVSRNEVQSFESDSQIRELAASHGLHPGFGTAPSVEMLLQDLATLAQEA